MYCISQELTLATNGCLSITAGAEPGYLHYDQSCCLGNVTQVVYAKSFHKSNFSRDSLPRCWAQELPIPPSPRGKRRRRKIITSLLDRPASRSGYNTFSSEPLWKIRRGLVITMPGSQECVCVFESLLDPQAGWPGRYITVWHCEGCLWPFCNWKTPWYYLWRDMT